MALPPHHAAWKVARDQVEEWLSKHRLESGWHDHMRIESDGSIVLEHPGEEMPREVFVKERQEHILVDALKAIEALNRL